MIIRICGPVSRPGKPGPGSSTAGVRMSKDRKPGKNFFMLLYTARGGGERSNDECIRSGSRESAPVIGPKKNGTEVRQMDQPLSLYPRGPQQVLFKEALQARVCIHSRGRLQMIPADCLFLICNGDSHWSEELGLEISVAKIYNWPLNRGKFRAAATCVIENLCYTLSQVV